MTELRSDLQAHFEDTSAFDEILRLDGEIYREQKNRRCLRFVRGGRGYFAKIHRGAGWREILKNLLYLRWPVVGARNELRALRRLQELGVRAPKLAGFGERGWDPARRQSFLITEEIENAISLEDFCRDWSDRPPPFQLRCALIDEVARIARSLHENGVNHRDFYICHFLLQLDGRDGTPDPDHLRLFLIDLHRTQLRRSTPQRWIVKDVAGLLFSSLDLGLTSRDCFRFMKAYRGRPLRVILEQEARFWRRVLRRGAALYRKLFRREPRLPVRARR